MDTDMLYKIQRAILAGQTLEQAGLGSDPESKATYLKLKKQLDEAPKGTMLQIIEDPEWGKWDSLIEATERAYGPIFGDKTLKEMAAERRAQVAAERKNPREDSAGN